MQQNRPACSQCSRKKARCSRDRPCQRCLIKNLHCHSPEPIHQLLPPAASSSSLLERTRLIPAVLANTLIYGHRHFHRHDVARALATDGNNIYRLRQLALSEIQFRSFQTLVHAWAHGDHDHTEINQQQLTTSTRSWDQEVITPRTIIRHHPDGSHPIFLLLFHDDVQEIALNQAAEQLWGYSLSELNRSASLYDDLVADDRDPAKRYAPFWMQLFSPSTVNTLALLALACNYQQCNEATFQCEIVRRHGLLQEMNVYFRRSGPCSYQLQLRQQPWSGAPRLQILDQVQHDHLFYTEPVSNFSGRSQEIVTESLAEVILFGFQIFSPFDVTEFVRHPNVGAAYRQLELVLLPHQIETFRNNVVRASLRSGFHRSGLPIRRIGHDQEQAMNMFLVEIGIRPMSRPAILMITSVVVDHCTKYTPWLNDVAQDLWQVTIQDLSNAFNSMLSSHIDEETGMKLAPIILRLFHPRSWPILAAIWNELWFRWEGLFTAPVEIQRGDRTVCPMFAYGCLMASPLSYHSHDTIAIAFCPKTGSAIEGGDTEP